MREMYAHFLVCDASRPLEINVSVRPLVISGVWLIVFKRDVQQPWHTWYGSNVGCVAWRFPALRTHRKAIYRMSQEECARLRESVPYVKVYRYNPKHLYQKLNGYGDNGQRSLKLWQPLHTYWLPNTYWNWQEYVVSVMLICVLNM